MANSRESALDAALREQQLGRVMLVLGGLLIAFDCIVGVWIWVGLRSGSDFWLWWVVIEGVLGLVLIGAGMRKRAHGSRTFGEVASR